MEKDLKYLYTLKGNCFGSTKFVGIVNKIKDNFNVDDFYVDNNHKTICTDALLPTPLWKTPQELTKMYNLKPISDKITFSVSENVIQEIIKYNKVKFFDKEFLINSYTNREETHSAFLKKHLCGILENYKIDKDFVKTQNEYIKNLSLSELSVLYYYTVGGDRVMNAILGGNFEEDWDIAELKYDTDLIYSLFFIILDELKNENIKVVEKFEINYLIELFPTLTDNFVKKILNIAIKTLQKIILNSPKVSKKMKVFRAIANYRLNEDSTLAGKNGIYYKNKRFVSTSLDPNSSLRFANKQEINKEGPPEYTLKVITLLPGSHGLFLAGISQFYEEFEILLPFDCVYLVRSKKICNQLVPDWCIHKKQNIFVEDIVVVK
jgi:hypothetical protein